MKVLGVAGSLRKGSYNRALLREAVALAPAGMEIEIAEIDTIPPYNFDVESAGFPEPVLELRRRVAAADALLIVTPEYNYSVPGVLKNAIDWVSRPPDQPLNSKPAAIMGASPGMLGTARCQMHLRQVAVFVNLLIMNQPEVLIARARDKFDAELRLTDEKTREMVRKLLAALVEWTKKCSGIV